MFKSLLLCVTTLVASVSAVDGAGLAVSVSQDGITDSKDIIVPYIFGMLKNVSIPDLNSSGLFLKNASISLPAPGKEDINITNVAAKNEIKLDADNIHFVMKADFEFKHSIFDVKGKIEIDVINEGLGLHLPLDFGT